jgi:OmpA-OmpF porin, OOP family
MDLRIHITLLLTTLLTITLPADAREALTDHPLIAPYEGSEIRRKNVQTFDEYNAFMGTDASGKEPTGLALEGSVSKLFYTKPKDRSILEVFRNYETALEASGAEILYTCDQEKYECVKAYAGPTLQKYSDLHAISNTAGRYLLARLDANDTTAYIAIAVGRTFTDIHVIEVKAMETGKVTLDAAALGKGLDTRGYVIVEGIYFDTDKATLKATSTPALKEVAKLLTNRADLSVYVVGHTDMQGNLAYNRTLSQRRADAVVAALATDFAIAKDRMQGFGVGPLAPQASNTNPSGRAKNRRVVLVAR